MKKQILNTESYSPLYKQLMQKLRADIQSGVYPVHSRIPSEQELCETYQVSRVTVRKALSELTQEGLLKRHQGKGTFVGIPRIQKDLRNVNSFHDACRMMAAPPAPGYCMCNGRTRRRRTALPWAVKRTSRWWRSFACAWLTICP